MPPALDANGVGPLASGPHHPGLAKVAEGTYQGGLRMKSKPKVFVEELRGPAFGRVLKVLDKYPGIAAEARFAYDNEVSPPESVQILAGIWAVSRWLRACKQQISESYVISGKALLDLLENAASYKEYVRWSVADLYQRRMSSGIANQLKPRERNVHKAILMLAYRDGSRIRVSLRYLAVLLKVEFDDNAYPSAIRNSLKRLESMNLIEVVSGKRSPGHTKWTIISIEFAIGRVYQKPMAA